MSSRPWDVRLRKVTWDPVPQTVSVKTRVRIMALIGLPLAVWYFGWLLNPDRIGTPVLYGILIAAELFNMIQALGFWWTCATSACASRRRRASGWRSTCSCRSTRSRRTSST